MTWIVMDLGEGGEILRSGVYSNDDFRDWERKTLVLREKGGV